MGLAVLVAPSVSEGADQKPAETCASLKKEQEAAMEELESRRKPGTTESEQKKALDRFSTWARRATVGAWLSGLSSIGLAWVQSRWT